MLLFVQQSIPHIQNTNPLQVVTKTAVKIVEKFGKDHFGAVELYFLQH